MVLVAALAPRLVTAQSIVSRAELIENWRMSKKFTLAVAEAMPDDKYSFRPNEKEMPFDVLMIHIATSQAFRFAQVAGKPMPLDVPKDIRRADAKRIAVQLLTESFDYCIDRLGELTEEQLSRNYKVDWYEKPETTGRQIVLAMFTHTAHHRAQAEVYLRVAGITPPLYRF